MDYKEFSSVFFGGKDNSSSKASERSFKSMSNNI
jgi:hypothetical protein